MSPGDGRRSGGMPLYALTNAFDASGNTGEGTVALLPTFSRPAPSRRAAKSMQSV